MFDRLINDENDVLITFFLSSSVTHVIVDTDIPNHLRLTFDVLLSILYGKWILNSGSKYFNISKAILKEFFFHKIKNLN